MKHPGLNYYQRLAALGWRKMRNHGEYAYYTKRNWIAVVPWRIDRTVRFYRTAKPKPPQDRLL